MVWKNKIKFSNAFCAINALQNNHEIFPQQKSRQKDGKSVCNIKNTYAKAIPTYYVWVFRDSYFPNPSHYSNFVNVDCELVSNCIKEPTKHIMKIFAKTGNS